MKKLIALVLMAVSASILAQEYSTVVYRQGEHPMAVPVGKIDSITIEETSAVNPVYYETQKDTIYVVPQQQSHWKGKRIGFLGDSITQNGEYVASYAGITGCNALNYGISATHLARIDANTTNAFEQRANTLPLNLDMIVVFGGTNDFGHKTTAKFGSFEDGTVSSRYTFYAGLHRLFSKLVKRFPNKPIVVMTPLHHGVEIDEPEYVIAASGSLTEGKNSVTGKTFREYVDAIKEVAAYYSLPVLDAYSYSGLSPMTEIGSNNRRFFKDGLHLSEKGGERLARWMYPQLEMIYEQYYK